MLVKGAPGSELQQWVKVWEIMRNANVDRLMQVRRDPIMSALELHLSCLNPSMCFYVFWFSTTRVNNWSLFLVPILLMVQIGTLKFADPSVQILWITYLSHLVQCIAACHCNGLLCSDPVFYLWPSKVSANEKRRYICNVLSHWLKPSSAMDRIGVLMFQFSVRCCIDTFNTVKSSLQVQHVIYHISVPYMMYRQTSNISCTLVGNKIVDHSDVVGASPVSAAQTTSSFLT